MSSPLRQIALFGHPVGHSRSAVFQNAGFQVLGLAWRYRACDLPTEAAFERAVSDVRTGVWEGANVTLPYKVSAARLVDELHESARVVGAVNTLVREGHRVVGSNTDLGGFVRSALECAPSASWEGKHVVVFGAGGAARAVVCGLDALGVERVGVLNRTESRARALVESLQGKVRARLYAGGLGDLNRGVFGWVQCTSLGVGCGFEGKAAERGRRTWREVLKGKKAQVALDIVYSTEEGRTLFLEESRALLGDSCRCMDGLSMLLYQGVESFALWTGEEPPEDEMRRALKASVYG